jgi:hypothetical protein
MRNRLVVLVAGIAAALAVLGTTVAQGGGRPLSTPMTGAEEAPDPGDPNASGQADLRLNQGQGEVCFDLSWTNIDGEVFAAHIHIAPAGSAGPVVVGLFAGSFAGTDSLSGCVQDVDRALIKAIRKNPAAYYVNVHSRPNFPGGAVRGQLGD